MTAFGALRKVSEPAQLMEEARSDDSSISRLDWATYRLISHIVVHVQAHSMVAVRHSKGSSHDYAAVPHLPDPQSLVVSTGLAKVSIGEG